MPYRISVVGEILLQCWQNRNYTILLTLEIPCFLANGKYWSRNSLIPHMLELWKQKVLHLYTVLIQAETHIFQAACCCFVFLSLYLLWTSLRSYSMKECCNCCSHCVVLFPPLQYFHLVQSLYLSISVSDKPPPCNLTVFLLVLCFLITVSLGDVIHFDFSILELKKIYILICSTLKWPPGWEESSWSDLCLACL